MNNLEHIDPFMPLLTAASKPGPNRLWALGTSLTKGATFGGVDTGGWRYPLKQICAEYGIPLDFVGTLTTNSGTDAAGSAAPTLMGIYGEDYEHDGLSGDNFKQIVDRMYSKYSTILAGTGTPAGAPTLKVIEFGANDSFGGTLADTFSAFDEQFKRIADFQDTVSGRIPIMFVGFTVQPDGSNAWTVANGNLRYQTSILKAIVQKYRDKGYPWRCMTPYDSTMADHWNPCWQRASADIHFNNVGNARFALEIFKALNGGFDPPKTANPLVGAVKMTSAADTYFPWGALVTPVGATDVIKAVTWRGDEITIGTTWTRGATFPTPVVYIYATGSTVTDTWVNQYAPGTLM